MNNIRRLIGFLVLCCAAIALPAQVTVRNGMSYTGTYGSGSTYAKGDVVISSGNLYMSLSGGNTGNTPASSPLLWQSLSGTPSGVTSFTGDGTLISNASSTGGVTTTLATAAAHKFWGNNTGSTTAPGYFSITNADLAPQPVQISTTFVGVPANSQVMLYAPSTQALTVPSSCTGSYATALVAATASTAFLIKDLTTSTTLCTATFAISGTTATFSGSGGSVSAGDVLEIIGPATADATLATIGVSIYATR